MKHIFTSLLMLCSIVAMTQSTLQIFVLKDDPRPDIQIIGDNVDEISVFGFSNDSTNVDYYVNTMSTQVIRLSYADLIGESGDASLSSADDGFGEADEDETEVQVQNSSIAQPTERSVTVGSTSSIRVRVKSKKIKLKKTKRQKQRKGHCFNFGR